MSSSLVSCDEHGDILVRMRLRKEADGTITARWALCPADEEKKAKFLQKLETQGEKYQS